MFRGLFLSQPNGGSPQVEGVRSPCVTRDSLIRGVGKVSIVVSFFLFLLEIKLKLSGEDTMINKFLSNLFIVSGLLLLAFGLSAMFGCVHCPESSQTEGYNLEGRL